MADRKHTPDVLAELLSPDLPPVDLPKAPPPKEPGSAPARKPPAPHEPKPRAERASQPIAAPDCWEVEIVSFQEHRGWRPRFVNGVELKDWLAGLLIHDYVNQRGAEGWELAGGTAKDRFYGSADGLQLYFKRRKR